jgi:glycosyltransferase involved in cell wall biosynthesis
LVVVNSAKAIFVQFTAEPSGSPMSGLLIVQALRRRGWAVDVVFSKAGECAKLYESAGCHVRMTPHGRWLGARRWWQQVQRWREEFRASREFTKLIRQRGADIVYVNNLTGASAALAAWRCGVPCVWHLREMFEDVGGEMRDLPVGGRRMTRWVLSRLATRIVAISRAVCENVLGDEVARPVEVVPNAVFEPFFSDNRTAEQCRALLGVPVDGPIIGMPGTLRPMKGHAFFLDAARRVAEVRPDVRFLITGEGEASYRASLVAAVDATLLRDRVTFIGNVSDMAAFYRACDIICTPSRCEPAGRVVIEAMAIGTPVVATAVGGIPESIDHGTTGLLVKYGDRESLKAEILRLLDEPALRQRLASAARTRAEREFREHIYQDRIMQIIDAASSHEPS